MSDGIKELVEEFYNTKKHTAQGLQDLATKLKQATEHDYWERRLYKYCKKHYPSLIRCCKMFRKRQRGKWDNQICIEGGTGSGKSTLAFTLMAVMAGMNETRLVWDRDVLFMPKNDELSTKMENLKDKQNLWVDETIMSLNKAKWMKKDTIRAAEIVQTERFRRNTIMYCLPSFSELTKTFRNTNVKFRIWIIPRFAAIVRIKDVDPDLAPSDPWHTDMNVKIKKKFGVTVQSTPEERLKVERKLPNYALDFMWPDVSEIEGFRPYHTLYEILKKAARLEKLEEMKQGDAENMNVHEARRMDWILGSMKHHREQGETLQGYLKLVGNTDALKDTTLEKYWRMARPDKPFKPGKRPPKP